MNEKYWKIIRRVLQSSGTRLKKDELDIKESIVFPDEPWRHGVGGGYDRLAIDMEEWNHLYLSKTWHLKVLGYATSETVAAAFKTVYGQMSLCPSKLFISGQLSSGGYLSIYCMLSCQRDFTRDTEAYERDFEKDASALIADMDLLETSINSIAFSGWKLPASILNNTSSIIEASAGVGDDDIWESWWINMRKDSPQ